MADDAPFPLRGSVALVTGANRGIGEAFTLELLKRGAAKVYGGARKPDSIQQDNVVPVHLDITKPDLVTAAAKQCGDITVLVNCAGVFRVSSLLTAPSIADARDEMETDYFGTLLMIRAFAPVLGRNGGGAIVNSLSVLSFVNYAPWGAYSAAKAAAWSLTNSARDELASQGTRVVGVHAGLVNTQMSAEVDLPKIDRDVFVTGALDALEAGHIEALVDDHTRRFKTLLAGHPENQASLG